MAPNKVRCIFSFFHHLGDVFLFFQLIYSCFENIVVKCMISNIKDFKFNGYNVKQTIEP